MTEEEGRRRLRHPPHVLCYGTTATNHASRAVARALHLVTLGWLWTLGRG